MSRTFWDRWAGAYDWAEGFNRRAVRGMCRYVAEQIPQGARVLECAAGTGAISLAAAGRAGQVLCTDLSEPMLERARAKAARQGVSNVSFAARDLLRLPDPDGCYDAVVAANVLHLLPEPQRAAGELWRVTKPGGTLILPTFLTGEAGAGFRGLMAIYRLLGFRPRHSYTREAYQAMLAGCGLARASLTVVDGLLPVGVGLLRKPAEPTPLRRDFV